MEFRESQYMNGWIGLFREEDDGILETQSFKDVKSAENYINKFTKALNDYLNNKAKSME